MTRYMYNNDVKIFDYPKFAEPFKDSIRANVIRIAKENCAEIEFIRKSGVRKESIIAGKIKQRGDHPGIVQPFQPMLSLKSEFRIPNSQIKNLIFDFGGVICNIDVKLAEKEFMALGLTNFDTGKSISSSSGLFEKIETGAITPEKFRTELNKFFSNEVTDDQIDKAWNALLLDIPAPRIRLLEQLRAHYRIFLLSNSNEIHYLKFLEDFTRKYKYRNFDDIFEKSYFSFNIGLKKPGTEIFKYVLADRQLDPSNTLFIDDTRIHVEGALKTGMHGYHLKISEGEQITDLFE